MVESLRAALEESKVDPALLTIELTETLLLQDLDQTHRLFDAFDAIGVRISIDDFGTGYSSLGYLRRLRVHELKIDKSFIDDVPGDADANAIVNAILAMARTLGIKTVAEGVEEQHQLKMLLEAGCEEVQGYLFSRPLPAEEFAEWFRSLAAEYKTAA